VQDRTAGGQVPGLRETLARGFLAVPNFFLDKVMPRVSAHFFKVLLAAWRKTVGYQKQQDWVSLSQFMKGTGLCRETVLAGLRFWEKAGLLRRGPRLGIRGTRIWVAVTDYDEAQVMARIEGLVGLTDQSVSSTPTGRSHPPPLVHAVDTQKTIIKRQSEKTTPATSVESVSRIPLMFPDERDRQDNLRRLREALARPSLTPAERKRLEAARAALQVQAPSADPPSGRVVG